MRKGEKVRVGIRLSLDGLRLLDEGRTKADLGAGVTRSLYIERLVRLAHQKGWDDGA